MSNPANLQILIDALEGVKSLATAVGDLSTMDVRLSARRADIAAAEDSLAKAKAAVVQAKASADAIVALAHESAAKIVKDAEAKADAARKDTDADTDRAKDDLKKARAMVLKAAKDEDDAKKRIAALEATIASLSGEVTAAQLTIAKAEAIAKVMG
jgi:predicted  nucleic acid-binding Zn-ribbon protein